VTPDIEPCSALIFFVFEHKLRLRSGFNTDGEVPCTDWLSEYVLQHLVRSKTIDLIQKGT
jgi:hypothetical protein